MKLFLLVGALLLAASQPAVAWDRYLIGPWQIFLSDSLMAVDSACKARFQAYGAQRPNGTLQGCTDLEAKLVISLRDAETILHEFCHLLLHTTSHELCPVNRRPGWGLP